MVPRLLTARADSMGPAIKSATQEEMAPLIVTPANTADSMGPAIKSATFQPVAPLMADVERATAANCRVSRHCHQSRVRGSVPVKRKNVYKGSTMGTNAAVCGSSLERIPCAILNSVRPMNYRQRLHT